MQPHQEAHLGHSESSGDTIISAESEEAISPVEVMPSSDPISSGGRACPSADSASSLGSGGGIESGSNGSSGNTPEEGRGPPRKRKGGPEREEENEGRRGRKGSRRGQGRGGGGASADDGSGNNAGDNAGGDNAGGDNAGGDHAGGDNAGGDNAGGDNAGGDNAGGDNAGGDNAGGDNAGGDNAGDNPGNNSLGDNFGESLGGDRPSNGSLLQSLGTGSIQQFVYTPTRASASKHVKEETFLLLLALSPSPDSLDWVEDFVHDLEGNPWVETNALTSESLKNLAHRCRRSKSMNTVSTFCKMLNELMFTSKVNRSLNPSLSVFHAQKMAFPSKNPSLYGILSKLKQEGFSEGDLGSWLSSGSRWARVAGAAAKNMTYRLGAEVSCTVLAEFCNQIRAPSEDNLALVSTSIVPSISKLQNVLSFSIPVLFSAKLRTVYRLPSRLDIAQLEATDWFFDLFYQRMYVNVPRNRELWKEALDFKPWAGQVKTFYSFNHRFLNFTAGTGEKVTAWDEEGPLSDDEMEEEVEVPWSNYPSPPKMIAFAGEIIKTDSEIWGPLYTVKCLFNSAEVRAHGTGLPYSTTDQQKRNKWTEEQRKVVERGDRPDTLEKFSEKVNLIPSAFFWSNPVQIQLQLRYDSESGSIRAKQKWLILTQEAIKGREVKVLDVDDKTIVSVDATLSEDRRLFLMNAVEALCKATGVKIQELNTSRMSINREFKVWHLSYYAKYGQSYLGQGDDIPEDFHPLHVQRSDGGKVNHCQFFVRASKDLQVFGREFSALSEAIGPILQKLVEKRLARDQDIFGKAVEAMVDVMPLQGFTPVRPFTGLVINVNMEETLEGAL
ncbi:hypothetical protein F5878DRAFT_645412 [Lentinula raphanica]|uniref:Uncharacterized protein n=1 Tax=Lentinula raphanica TaxID=153919 RepID=A0AA38U8E7_9AGAR|nr:hypothetical protein F5878DRAFT_645412 [Lentinula raphanica]